VKYKCIHCEKTMLEEELEEEVAVYKTILLDALKGE
jgi:DNA-directed RNA polymerase subunit RPC12/RpoP